MDECQGENDCHEDSFCSNTIGSYTCTCHEGYADRSGNGTDCKDIDECRGGIHNCHTSARCVNEPGNFSCQCRSGYGGDGTVSVGCSDVDECAEGTHGCSSGLVIEYSYGYKVTRLEGKCKNTAGSYECECPDGYDIYMIYDSSYSHNGEFGKYSKACTKSSG